MSELPDAMIDGSNMMALEDVPLADVIKWARNGDNPTSRWLADAVERMQTERTILRAWLDEQIAGPYAVDDREARIRVNILKEVRERIRV